MLGCVRYKQPSLVLSGLTQKLSQTLIPTLREAAAASTCPTLGDATRSKIPIGVRFLCGSLRQTALRLRLFRYWCVSPDFVTYESTDCVSNFWAFCLKTVGTSELNASP